MASIASNVTPNPNPNTNVVVLSLRKPLSCTFASNSSLFGNKFIGKSLSASIQRKRSDTARFAGLAPINASSSSHSVDVVIVGAGIIGMSITRQFLLESDLSVAVVDAAVPCSGATGAGQGYLWMVHKEPGNDKWELAIRSRKLWEMMAENVQQQGMNPLEILGWKKTDREIHTEPETTMRKCKEESHQRTINNQREIEAEESPNPSNQRTTNNQREIKVESSNRAEIDERTMNDNHEEEQLRQSRDKSIGSRSQEEAVARELLVARSLQSNQTNHRDEKVDSGASRGSLLVGKTPKQSAMLKRKVDQLSEAGLRAEFLSSCDLLLEEPALMVGEEGGAAFLPDDCQLDAQCTVAFIEKTFCIRRQICRILSSASNQFIEGHLLVLENLNSIKLNHGLMEVGYVDHEAAALDSSVSASGPVHAQISSISMTATMDAWGNLVLGSSRQFVGFDTEIDESIINRIWERAVEFFPALIEFSLRDFRESREVRIGLRPYMPDGKPMIGPVPGLSNLFLAAGHEGEGLSLALGTAEMVANMVLGNPGKVDHAPFSLESRSCMFK